MWSRDGAQLAPLASRHSQSPLWNYRGAPSRTEQAWWGATSMTKVRDGRATACRSLTNLRGDRLARRGHSRRQQDVVALVSVECVLPSAVIAIAYQVRDRQAPGLRLTFDPWCGLAQTAGSSASPGCDGTTAKPG